MIIEMLMICAITTSSPFYDCDEKWIVSISDQRYPEACKPLGNRVMACVFYSERAFINKIISPTMYIGNGTEYRDEFGNNNLLHEIKHLQCLCGWHD